MIIRRDQNIVLPAGYSELTVEGEEEIKLDLEAPQDCQVYVRIAKACRLELQTRIGEGVEATFLFWNDAEDDLTVEETHQVGKSASLSIAYGEVNGAVTNRKATVNLNEEEARALLSSASLVRSTKRFEILVVSRAPRSEGIIENYAVVLKGGRFTMDATGSIIKGAHDACSHQTSRALCFAEDQFAQIKPKLLIDENEVQASHATTLGRVDEDQLYYMMSRGLNIKQCTELIATGYLMPVTRIIKNDKLQAILAAEMERKIAGI